MSYVDDDIEWSPAQHNPVITQQYRGREQFLNGAVAAASCVSACQRCLSITRRDTPTSALPSP
jgi:hypothetical protein